MGNYVEVWTEGHYGGLYCLTDRVNRKLLGCKKMKGEALRGIVYKCVSYDKGCYLLSDATEPVEGNENWNAWEVKYPNEFPSYIFNPLQQMMDAPWDSVPDEAAYMAEWYQANHDRLDELLLPYHSDGIEKIEQETIVNSKSSDYKWFDLQGRKVANGKLPKGIYFKGHKKILIK